MRTSAFVWQVRVKQNMHIVHILTFIIIMMASLIQQLKPANSLNEMMNIMDFIKLELRCNQHNSDTHHLLIEIL